MKSLKINCAILIFLAFPVIIKAQQVNDSTIIKKIYTASLLNHKSFNNLKYLVDSIGGRICGSENADKAVNWAYNTMKSLPFDTVYLQECMVKHWQRDIHEYAYINLLSKIKLHTVSLGGSVATPNNGIEAKVIEVKNFEELKNIPRSQLEGKIIFFNRPANPEFINTFQAYGDAVNQRVYGAIEASKYGGVAALVRSITLSIDTFPHTGIIKYENDLKKIPSISIATQDADLLHDELIKNPNLSISIKALNKEFPEKKSYNVIGEIKGSEFPDEYITVGGHLDSWDIDPGAHDDGTGCMQALDVAILFNKINLIPKHTVRVVLFMDEEYAQRGGRKYAEEALKKKEKHIAALESDAGGLSPRGFSISKDSVTSENFIKLKKYFSDYGLHEFINGYGGVDIQFLKTLNVPQIGFMVDSQRYFDYHHAASDTIDKVNKREMQLGSAAIAALVFLIDKYGL